MFSSIRAAAARSESGYLQPRSAALVGLSGIARDTDTQKHIVVYSKIRTSGKSALFYTAKPPYNEDGLPWVF